MKEIDRRGFIKALGAFGLGTLAGASADATGAQAGSPEVSPPPNAIPTRPFGQTGMHVPILAFGGSHDLVSKQLLLRQAFKMGVTYWDTAHGYSDSEEAMGKYFDKFPEDRKKVFLVTKASSSAASELDKSLATSLERLKCDHIDLFFIHGISNVEKDLTPEIKAWAQRTKSSGKIRFFGFSTHKNMAPCLTAASKLGWIDGIMASYNYRLMHLDEMKRAVDACAAAGIGLTAMKTQAPLFSRLWATVGNEDETAAALTDRFMQKGFSPEQAKLKAVWENGQIASICSEMPNMTILNANAAAAMDRTTLSREDKQMLDQHAAETASFYCTGCADICESALDCQLPISDILRSLMYAQGYGEPDKARRILGEIDTATLAKLTTADLTAAERACPRRLSLGRLMQSVPALLA